MKVIFKPNFPKFKKINRKYVGKMIENKSTVGVQCAPLNHFYYSFIDLYLTNLLKILTDLLKSSSDRFNKVLKQVFI